MKEQSRPCRLAVLASGAGTNARRFFEYFRDHPFIAVSLVVSNNASAPVLEHAAREGIPAVVLPGAAWDNEERIADIFENHGIDAVVLAGYMRLVPAYFVRRYAGRIFNIHPALLPRFGGRGMHGLHVHRAVIDSGERQTGITVHLVNERYDEGPVLFRDSVPVLATDTPETLSDRVRELEHKHYPRVVEAYLMKRQ